MEKVTLAADSVIFAKNRGLKVLLIKRKNEPFKGKYALPGGIIEKDEEVEDTAARELEEETGLKNIPLKRFNIYTKVNRDPRGRVVSVAFMGILDSEQDTNASTDAESAEWFPVNTLPELAFDHKEIILDALENLNSYNYE